MLVNLGKCEHENYCHVPLFLPVTKTISPLFFLSPILIDRNPRYLSIDLFRMCSLLLFFQITVSHRGLKWISGAAAETYHEYYLSVIFGVN